jgi:hypothetical protein
MSEDVILGLSLHRPEMVPFSEVRMRSCDIIFLEEPPTDGFGDMLKGAMDLDEYLMPLDLEYPAFSRRMCRLLQDLMSEGKTIYQVEPYLETLVSIHVFFADGHGPEELSKSSLQYPVYLAERRATGALLQYYQTVMNGSFEETIKAIQNFARLDAARFRLRDSLRAQALAPMLENDRSAFIEAGAIHHYLWHSLRRQISRPHRLKAKSLAHDALKTIDVSGHLYGPGDQLTLLYIYHPHTVQLKRESLLAARSIIYSKLVGKIEIDQGVEKLPHLRNELACIRLTNQLSLDECRQLFPRLRRSSTGSARQIMADYMNEDELI